jgi:Fe-S cluster assembly protein SufB
MIDPSVVRDISDAHNEPDWMLKIRLNALELYNRLPEPKWLRGVDDLSVEDLILYKDPGVKPATSWEELPEDVRRLYERLNLPEYEKEYLAGLSTSLDSETIYSKVLDPLREKGVILEPLHEAVLNHPDLVRKYFSRIYPPADHKYAALHYALWSGGVFLYVPPGVKLDLPIEAFFYISTELEGQFEHSVIVADKGAEVHFIEGCSAPVFRSFAFHDGAVEVYAAENAYVKFTTVQNWSKNIINFNNKRAIAEKNAFVEWVEGSIGARTSIVYPSVILRGESAKTTMNVFSISHGPYVKDGGAKIFHVAPNTRSTVVSKGISSDGGVNIYRGLVRILKGAKNAFSHVSCDSLILDDKSEASTYPHAQVDEPSAVFTHEATTVRFSEDQLFYLQSRGLNEEEAKGLAVLGFIQDILRGLPLEYASVLREVLNADFSGGVG